MNAAWLHMHIILAVFWNTQIPCWQVFRWIYCTHSAQLQDHSVNRARSEALSVIKREQIREGRFWGRRKRCSSVTSSPSLKLLFISVALLFIMSLSVVPVPVILLGQPVPEELHHIHTICNKHWFSLWIHLQFINPFIVCAIGQARANTFSS